VVALLLAKDATGDPALFNAMQLDRADAISAYVRAVLASDVKSVNQRALLRPEEPKGMTTVHNAFTENLSTMLAYVDAVLGSTSKSKQQFLDWPTRTPVWLERLLSNAKTMRACLRTRR
jgi:hypothetical protein